MTLKIERKKNSRINILPQNRVYKIPNKAFYFTVAEWSTYAVELGYKKINVVDEIMGENYIINLIK